MYNDYLNNIFNEFNSNIKLDDEQKRVVLNDSKNSLIVAGAGSGKTTVISAKVKYLIDIKKIEPSKILVISFTRESVNDLKRQIIDGLRLEIIIQTFHKLALSIIGKNNSYKICDNLKNILSIYFLRDIYFTPDYLSYLNYLYTFVYIQNKSYFKINDKISVTSLEEIAIVNFLNLTKINFKYKIINFNNIISKFILYIENNIVVINYLNKYKRKKTKKNIYNIVKDNDVIFNIRKILEKNGVYKYDIIENNEIEYIKFLNVCCSFINCYKVNNINEYFLISLIKKYEKNYQISLFLNVIFNAYKYYINHNKINHILDFNDIINEAIKKLKQEEFNKYKYVIIDEFQDISKNRLEIIKYLSKYKTNIIACGDDWQSIFGFAGSDVNLFINFPKIIKNCEVLRITNTYRNSKQLIDISGNFIMKNNHQLKKELKSGKSLDKPIIINFFDEKNNISKLIYDVILNIVNKSVDSNILIIGRYKFSINKIIDKEYFDFKNNRLVCLKKNINVTFLTAHSSKGLTFDEVIILDMDDDIYGFPSQIVDNLELSILKNKDNFYFEEERRLFYVALTRTRGHNYLFSHIDKISPYIYEFLDLKEVEVINYTKRKIKRNVILCKNCGYFFKNNIRFKHICPNCGNIILK